VTAPQWLSFASSNPFAFSLSARRRSASAAYCFLSQYRVSIDLDRSVVGLERNTGLVH
jgi:hypothetical protein